MKKETGRIKTELIMLILACVIILGTLGVTFAWFRNLQQLNTVALVQTPSRITLSGANRSELQKISLELTGDDIQNEDQVTIRRVFCIESTNDFILEVVRTTNINNMDIKIYPVTASNSDLNAGTVKGSDGVQTFYYNPDAEPLAGAYINQDANSMIAIQKDGLGTLHDENYDTDDVVQQNAEPLYWRITKAEEYNRAEYSTKGESEEGATDIYYRYYVLELSWNTSEQETDMIYLIASHSEQ